LLKNLRFKPSNSVGKDLDEPSHSDSEKFYSFDNIVLKEECDISFISGSDKMEQELEGNCDDIALARTWPADDYDSDDAPGEFALDPEVEKFLKKMALP
jgi:hypothetical protein